jgi:CMP-N-acetylneuraminic acid synthetase
LAITLDAIRRAGILPETVVSTEDADIAAVARAEGCRVVDRPENLAADAAATEAVLLHALELTKADGRQAEWVMTLPPTSPFRKPETIRDFIARAQSAPADVDCLMSVTENRGDFWRQSPTGDWQRLFPNAPRRQQDREPLFEENSAIYVTRIAALRDTGSILGRKVLGVPIPSREAFDINTPEDLAVAEALWRQTTYTDNA